MARCSVRECLQATSRGGGQSDTQFSTSVSHLHDGAGDRRKRSLARAAFVYPASDESYVHARDPQRQHTDD